MTNTEAMAEIKPVDGNSELMYMLGIAPGDSACIKEKIVALQDELLKLPQSNIRTYHSFLPGIYERTVVIPPWTVLTGVEHLTGYKVSLVQGRVAVNIGNEISVLTAPLELEFQPGAQRALRVFEEQVIWVDTYENPGDSHDINGIEDRIYAKTKYGLADSRTPEQWAMIKADLIDNNSGPLIADLEHDGKKTADSCVKQTGV